MRRKRFAPEKIISMLREAEVSLSQGLVERENGRLKKAVVELTLDKLIMGEALEGNY
jgi:hypothetical protein